MSNTNQQRGRQVQSKLKILKQEPGNVASVNGNFSSSASQTSILQVQREEIYIDSFTKKAGFAGRNTVPKYIFTTQCIGSCFTNLHFIRQQTDLISEIDPVYTRGIFFFNGCLLNPRIFLSKHVMQTKESQTKASRSSVRKNMLYMGK